MSDIAHIRSDLVCSVAAKRRWRGQDGIRERRGALVDYDESYTRIAIGRPAAEVGRKKSSRHAGRARELIVGGIFIVYIGIEGVFT